MAEVRSAVLAGAALVVAFAGSAGATPPPERQAELLHQLRHDCGSCHGLTMRGGLGPPLLPAALEGRPAPELAEVVLDGVPRTPMPPWRSLITEDEALWLVQRLKEGLDED
jgi:cytochrome c55X